MSFSLSRVLWQKSRGRLTKQVLSPAPVMDGMPAARAVVLHAEGLGPRVTYVSLFVASQRDDRHYGWEPRPKARSNKNKTTNQDRTE